MNDIKDTSIQKFLDELASKKATPGGGSAAAIMGAQSAALTGMVCQLTIGKPKYAPIAWVTLKSENATPASNVSLSGLALHHLTSPVPAKPGLLNPEPNSKDIRVSSGSIS